MFIDINDIINIIYHWYEEFKYYFCFNSSELEYNLKYYKDVDDKDNIELDTIIEILNDM